MQEREEGSKLKRRKICEDSKKKKLETNLNNDSDENIVPMETDDNEIEKKIEELEEGECSDTSSEVSDVDTDVSTSTASDDGKGRTALNILTLYLIFRFCYKTKRRIMNTSIVVMSLHAPVVLFLFSYIKLNNKCNRF